MAVTLGSGCADAEADGGSAAATEAAETGTTGSEPTTGDATSTDPSTSGAVTTTGDPSTTVTSTTESPTSTDPTGETTGGGDPGFGPWCEEPPYCAYAPPPPGPELDWEHTSTNIVVFSGDPNHRVRDMFYVPGEPQWLMGKFAYGRFDDDLKDERVDVYLSRGCTGEWELIAEAWTTEEEEHPTVEGVEDSGGWVFYQLLPEQELELGRHRVHMVVRGDQSTADGFIEVVEPGTPVFVSDVDGTLTTSETQEFFDLLTGSVPDPNPSAPEALSALQAKGFHAMYLTARPEWLAQRTRDFVEFRGFPPGIIHTSLNFDGALASAAEELKTAELQMLIDKGLVPTYVFGNTDSDGAAYRNAGIMPLENRIFFQHDDPDGGRRIEDYGVLVPEFEALDDPCD